MPIRWFTPWLGIAINLKIVQKIIYIYFHVVDIEHFSLCDNYASYQSHFLRLLSRAKRFWLVDILWQRWRSWLIDRNQYFITFIILKNIIVQKFLFTYFKSLVSFLYWPHSFACVNLVLPPIVSAHSMYYSLYFYLFDFSTLDGAVDYNL